MNPSRLLPVKLVSVLLVFLPGLRVFAQVADAPGVPDAPSVETAAALSSSTTSASFHATPQQLDQLLGPVALYPDALIALILPSATAASDVVLAARYLSADGESAEIENQSWDDSVKALAHYPDVVKWMDQNLAWTKQVGEAFLDQPAEVMKSIQRLRTAARAAGTLIDTPQQQVVVETGTITIVPAQPDVIYVPYYDPEIVYLPRRSYGYYPHSFFSFSIGYPVGYWLGNHMDWRHCRLWTVDHHARERYWREQRDWRRPAFPAVGVTWTRDSIRRPWSPPHRAHSSRHVHSVRAEIARPSSIRHDSHREVASSWNGSGHTDRSRGIRDSSRRSLQTPRTSSTANGFQPLSAPLPALSAPLPAVAQPPTPATTNSDRVHSSRGSVHRGNRTPQPAEQNPRENSRRENVSRGHNTPRENRESTPRENRDRSEPRRARNEAPAPSAAPAPSPSAPVVAAVNPVAQGSRAGWTQRAAPAPAEAKNDSTPASSSSDSNRRGNHSHRGRGN